MSQPVADELITRFDQTFFSALNTRLVHAQSEPEYIPANTDNSYHQICFAHGFASSALHEIAHWCVAGQQRRLQYDFGYWYEPDGRSAQQQHAFLRVEVKPQALEWVFSKACGMDFKPSLDNLNGEPTDIQNFVQFAHSVSQQAQVFCAQGLPRRAAQWAASCAQFYGVSDYLNPLDYAVDSIL